MTLKRPSLPLILTAQDLTGGGVVYWTGDRWSPRFEDAAIAADAAAAAALEAARDAGLRAGNVIDAFLFGVGDDAQPRHFRERARLHGPSVRDGGGPRVSL